MHTTDTPLRFTLRLWSRLNRRTINGAHPQWTNRGNRAYLEHGVELRVSLGRLLVFVEENWHTVQSIRDAGGQPSIDRIDSEGHYEAGNLRILPLAMNTRRRADDLHLRILEVIGEVRGNRTRAAEVLGISVRTVQRRLNTTR